MVIFDITLEVEAGQMYCGLCSNTIRGCLVESFPDNTLSISTHFKKSIIEISVELIDKNAAKQFSEKCIEELKKVSYDCSILLIEDVDSIMGEGHNPEPENHSLWSFFPLLAFGISIMLVEHYGVLPKPSTSPGTLARLGIGSVSTVISGWFGRHHLKNAWKARGDSSRGAMDSLIVLGSLVALTYSFLRLLVPYFHKNKESMTFFDVPPITLGLIKLSHGIRNKVHGTIESEIDAIAESKSRLPKVARVYLEEKKNIATTCDYKIEEKNWEQFYVSKIEKGSMICVSPNEIVPIDGIFLEEKECKVRENFYGRKEWVAKKKNDLIYAGSINKSQNPFLLKTVCSAEDNRIRKAYKSVKINDVSLGVSVEVVSRYFFRGVLAIATVSFTGWLIGGPSWPDIDDAVQVSLSELLCACPCALGLIGVALNVTKTLAFQAGILVQNDRALSIDCVTDICIDKCGTVTTSEYSFKEIVSIENEVTQEQEDKWLAYAIVLENKIPKSFQSAIARAILEIQSRRNFSVLSDNMVCTNFLDNPINRGRGGVAIINEQEIVLGNKNLLKTNGIPISSDWERLASKHASQDELPLFFAMNKQLCGLFILEPKSENNQLLRPHTKSALEWLIRQGKKIHFLTGDSQDRTAVLMNQFSGYPIEFHAELTPQDKINIIKELQEQKKIVVMLGDDQNDKDALRQADIGLAIDSMAPIRGEASAVLNGSLKELVQLICLAKIHRRGYNLSLFWSFGINSLAILSASGIFEPLTGQLFDPMITTSVMAVSSLFLILNIGVFKILGARAIKQVDKLLDVTETQNSLSMPFLLKNQRTSSSSEWIVQVNPVSSLGSIN